MEKWQGILRLQKNDFIDYFSRQNQIS